MARSAGGPAGKFAGALERVARSDRYYSESLGFNCFLKHRFLYRSANVSLPGGP